MIPGVINSSRSSHAADNVHGLGAVAPRSGASVGECVVCDQKIRSGCTPLTCSGCGRLCHRQWQCSRLSRAQQSRGFWGCQRCVSVGESSPVRPVATLAGAVVGEEAVVHAARSQREPCAKCGKGVPPCRRPLRCGGCDHAVHKQCSGLSRNQLASQAVEWKCAGCATTPTVDTSGSDERATGQLARGSNRGCGKPRNTLRILQWNADGVSTKVSELESFLASHRVDVCILQESKLLAGDRTPSLADFTVLRRDREQRTGGSVSRGGGAVDPH